MRSEARTIRGQWHGRTYTVEKELGRGATGIVYLVRRGNNRYALKLGEDSISITAEANVLQQLGKAQGIILGPSVHDVDDWLDPNTREKKPFYVMNVIQGTPLTSFIQHRGKEWIAVFVVQLLHFLQHLHDKGWVFGDLKPDNLHVVDTPPKVAWFDPGGMTKMNRMIKEYTELYDRGYWQMGDRKAEPAYDLFSLAMIVLALYHGEFKVKQTLNGAERERLLQQKVINHIPQKPYQQVVWKGLSGRYRSAADMKKEWFWAWHLVKGGPDQHRRHQSANMPGRTVHSAQAQSAPAGHHQQFDHQQFDHQQFKDQHRMSKPRQRKKRFRLGKAISFFFISSFLLFLFALLLFTQTM